MGYRVKLATSGIAGVTRLTAGVLDQTDNNSTVSGNSVNVLQGLGTFSVNLPAEPVLSGTIVEFKNLLEVDIITGDTAEVTINSNGANVDGIDSNVTTSSRNEVFKLIYINTAIGWLVI